MQLQLFPDPAPDSFVGLFVFSRRGRGGWGCCGGVSGAGGGGVVVGKWGGIGSKMYKNSVPPISTHVFPRSIQERLLFDLSCLNGDQHLSYY